MKNLDFVMLQSNFVTGLVLLRTHQPPDVPGSPGMGLNQRYRPAQMLRAPQFEVQHQERGRKTHTEHESLGERWRRAGLWRRKRHPSERASVATTPAIENGKAFRGRPGEPREGGGP
jgi:hypothetical protein